MTPCPASQPASMRRWSTRSATAPASGPASSGSAVPISTIEPLLAILAAHGYQPDFITPAPDSPFTEIGAELDRVRATPPEKVAAELAECLGPKWDTQQRNGGPAAARDLLADLLRRARGEPLETR